MSQENDVGSGKLRGSLGPQRSRLEERHRRLPRVAATSNPLLRSQNAEQLTRDSQKNADVAPESWRDTLCGYPNRPVRERLGYEAQGVGMSVEDDSLWSAERSELSPHCTQSLLKSGTLKAKLPSLE